MIWFAGFQLDDRRAELRSSDGKVIRLRGKCLALLRVLVSNPGTLHSKQDLMDAVWPNVHVGEDSLFQCIREIRAALGDEKHELIKVVSGRGYLFDAAVHEGESAPLSDVPVVPRQAIDHDRPPSAQPPLGRAYTAAIAMLALAAVIVVVYIARPEILGGSSLPAIAVRHFAPAGGSEGSSSEAEIRAHLVDGLAKIHTVRVLEAPDTAADYVITADLRRSGEMVEIRARMAAAKDGEIKWTSSMSINSSKLNDPDLEHDRLAAGIGSSLAHYIGANLTGVATSTPAAEVVIEQANAQIAQTSLERFAIAREMLEGALATYPDNSDLQVALSAHLLRAIQMAWYKPEDVAAAKLEAQDRLEQALALNPNSVPAHEAYCRLLTTTNQFKEALVACARVLTLDPWNGIARYNIGLAQLYLGRFADALATFMKAEQHDTPELARWTWKLGAGWAYLMMDRPDEAFPWLEAAIAITPASGRPYFLLSAAYQKLGRIDEARSATAMGLKTRPGSTSTNIRVPMENASPVFIESSRRIAELAIAAGLPR